MDLSVISLEGLLEMKDRYEDFCKYSKEIGDQETARKVSGTYWKIVNEIYDRQ